MNLLVRLGSFLLRFIRLQCIHKTSEDTKIKCAYFNSIGNIKLRYRIIDD